METLFTLGIAPRVHHKRAKKKRLEPCCWNKTSPRPACTPPFRAVNSEPAAELIKVEGSSAHGETRSWRESAKTVKWQDTVMLTARSWADSNGTGATLEKMHAQNPCLPHGSETSPINGRGSGLLNFLMIPARVWNGG